MARILTALKNTRAEAEKEFLRLKDKARSPALVQSEQNGGFCVRFFQSDDADECKKAYDYFLGKGIECFMQKKI